MLDLLGHLIDKSLVIADGEAEPRYHLLETHACIRTRAARGDWRVRSAAAASCAQVICELMAKTDANCWNLSPAERRRAVQELEQPARRGRLGDGHHGSTARSRYELLGKCWLAWLHNGLTGEGVQRMLQLWPPPSDLPTIIEADFCPAPARLNEGAGREEHWRSRAARRSVVSTTRRR